MADAWDALLAMPKAAEGYAQGQLETDPWSFASKGIGAAKYQFDNPWAQIAAQALQGLGVGATSQMAQNNYNENLSNAYTQMLAGLSSGQKLKDPEMQNAMEPIRALYNVGLSREDYENKKDIAKEERQFNRQREMDAINFGQQKQIVELNHSLGRKGDELASPQDLVRARGVLMANGVAGDEQEAQMLIPEGATKNEVFALAYGGEARRGASASGELMRPMPMPEEARKRVSAAVQIDENMKPFLQKLESIESKLPKDKLGKFTIYSLEKVLPTSEAQDLKQNLEFLAYQYVVDAQGRGASDAEQQILKNFLAGSAALSTGEIKNRLIRMKNSAKRNATSYLATLTEPQFATAVNRLRTQIPAEESLIDNFGGPSPQTQYDPATEAAIQKRMAEIAAGQG